ncbi:subtilisin-like protein [Aaosphaeria arxii CBS 175.79]|uniref:Subtilisin-like protein n=1 Tax=Aaosphaeria arxii CBS 175.79 TaxID=1450172 RepID=A0A6A5XFG7_9PLEO|nr:subtilisin-like protein [Aaosphaeria arxii CBS 175.79]KAF2011878.1 subtilisin-like protein [Aaosphaeria arxii CBS 175.79]
MTDLPPLESGPSSPSASIPTSLLGISKSSSVVPTASITGIPPSWIMDVVIDSQEYNLPSPNQPPSEIFLSNGEKALLMSDRVIMRGETLEIPAGLTSMQQIKKGDQTVKAQPGKSSRPSGGNNGGGGGKGGGGGGGIFGAIGKIARAAGSAARGVASVGKHAANLATGGAGSAIGGLSGALSTAVKDVGSVVSSINGVQQDLSFEALNTGKGALNTVLNAQNLGRNVGNFMKSMSTALKNFDKLTPEVQQQIFDSIKEFSKPEGTLEKAQRAMKDFEDFPWDEQEVPSISVPSGTSMPVSQSLSTAATQSLSTAASTESQSVSLTSMASTLTPSATQSLTSSQSTTESSTSSSSTAGPSETPVPYIIQTKEGTSVEAFNAFIRDLDGGVGVAQTFEPLLHQLYCTKIAPTKAAELKMTNPLIGIMVEETFDPTFMGADDTFNAPAASRRHGFEPHHSNASKISRALIPEQQNAPWWKRILSSPPTSPLNPPHRDPGYLADDSAGEKTTIYIIDSGFDLSIPALQEEGRTIRTYFPPNDIAFPVDFLKNLRKTHPEATIEEERLNTVNPVSHGTKMAAIAGGKLHGIAQNADLYLLKTKGVYNTHAWKNPLDHSKGKVGPQDYGPTPKAIATVLSKVGRDISDRLAKDPSARSVINMSFGTSIVGTDNRGREMEPFYADFFRFIETVKATVVVAAGNDPDLGLHQQVPQKFGTTTNQIITVGGVNEEGKIYDQTCHPHPGQPGSMTLYAPATNVIAPGHNNELHLNTDFNTGTSQAAAIISGLAAYFLSHPEINLFNHGDIPIPRDDMKKFMTSHAWTRVPREDFVTPPLFWPRVPIEHLNVPYNLARGDTFHPDIQCQIPFRKRGENKTATACSMSSKTAPTTLSTGTRFVMLV